MLTSRFGRLIAIGALGAISLTGACSSDDDSSVQLGTMLKEGENAPNFDESVFTCLNDYEGAKDFSDDGVKTLEDEDSEITDLSTADLKILSGAVDECVTPEDFAAALAEDGSVTEESITCLVDKLGGVGAVFEESAKGNAEEPSDDFAAAMTECEAGGGVQLGTMLKEGENAPNFDESVFTCLNDYDGAKDFSEDGVKTLEDEDSEITELSTADLKILSGAVDECVTPEDFAAALAEDGSVTEESITCLVDKLGGVGAVFEESAKGNAEEPSEDFAAAMTECIAAG